MLNKTYYLHVCLINATRCIFLPWYHFVKQCNYIFSFFCSMRNKTCHAARKKNVICMAVCKKIKVLRVWHEFPPYPGGHLQIFGATQVPPCWQLQIALNKNTCCYNKNPQYIYYFQFQLLFHFFPFHARRHFKAEIVVIYNYVYLGQILRNAERNWFILYAVVIVYQSKVGNRKFVW